MSSYDLWKCSPPEEPISLQRRREEHADARAAYLEARAIRASEIIEHWREFGDMTRGFAPTQVVRGVIFGGTPGDESGWPEAALEEASEDPTVEALYAAENFNEWCETTYG